MSIPGNDFIVLVGAEEKIHDGSLLENLTEEEQRVVTIYGLTPRKMCGCGNCNEPLERNVDGRPYMIDGKVVNSDCYFEQWGEELKKHPIVTPRSRHGAF